MLPDWRIAQLRAGATALAQSLSDNALLQIAKASEHAQQVATGDNRTEMAIVTQAYQAEIARREAEK